MMRHDNDDRSRNIYRGRSDDSFRNDRDMERFGRDSHQRNDWSERSMRDDRDNRMDRDMRNDRSFREDRDLRGDMNRFNQSSRDRWSENFNLGNDRFGSSQGGYGNYSMDREMGLGSGLSSGSSYGQNSWNMDNNSRFGLGSNYSNGLGYTGGMSYGMNRPGFISEFGMGQRNEMMGQDFQRDQGSHLGIGNQSSLGSFSQGRGQDLGMSQSSVSQGMFRGRGPKGYQRSDERIREEVCEVLSLNPYVDASEIEVNVKNGEVTLSGTIESRQARRMAEEIIENLSGVKEVHNTLRVSSQSQMNLSGMSSQQVLGSQGQQNLGSNQSGLSQGTLGSQQSQGQLGTQSHSTSSGTSNKATIQ